VIETDGDPNMRKILLPLALVAAIGGAGCTNMTPSQQGTLSGAAIGAAGGAGIAAIAGGDAGVGAIVGGVVGGIVGHAEGR
jgi:hypothetical protein